MKLRKMHGEYVAFDCVDPSENGTFSHRLLDVGEHISQSNGTINASSVTGGIHINGKI